jgi:hypothetical protein
MFGGEEGEVRSGEVGWDSAVQYGKSWVRFPMGTMGFVTDLVPPAALQPWDQVNL